MGDPACFAHLLDEEGRMPDDVEYRRGRPIEEFAGPAEVDGSDRRGAPEEGVETPEPGSG